MGDVVGGAANITLVEDDEEVARLCFKSDWPVTHDGKYPSEIDPVTRLYRLEEFQWKDFSKQARSGFSVQRTSLFSQTDAKRVLEERIARKQEREKPLDGYDLEGVVIARVSAIHGIKDADGQSTFLVSPESTPDSPAHSAIRTSETCNSGEFLKYRKELQTAFGQLQSVEILPEEN